MNDDPFSLQGQLEKLEAFLADRGSGRTMQEEKLQELFINVAGVRRRLAGLGDNILSVGLIGGTGVGKSTLMNALAKENIASTSHRRPHTNAVLVYRHEAASLPPVLGSTTLPWRDHVHEAEEVRHVILCDLPDFDSIDRGHRDTVMTFLEALDVLVWVLSPEKYADGSLYEFLKLSPKDRGNCYFVLNKTDLFFEKGSPSAAGGESLMKAMARLEHHLKDAGIEEPYLYHVSAAESLAGADRSAWNQFGLLRRELFRIRDVKELRRIKAANIDAELEPVFLVLEDEERRLSLVEQMIQKGTAITDHDRDRVLKDLRATASPWIAARVVQTLPGKLADGNALLGPGRIIAALACRLWGLNADNPGKIAVMRGQAVTELSAALQRHLAASRERLLGDIYRQASLSTIPEEWELKGESVQVAAAFEEELSRLFLERDISVFQRSFSFFRLYQGMVYGVLMLVFFLVLPGEDTWKSLFAEPGLLPGVRVLVMMVISLFTPRGLAAMGSLFLIAGILGWRFYGRFKDMIRAEEASLTHTLKEEIDRLVIAAVGSQEKEMERLGEEIRLSLSTLRDILGSRRKVK